MLLDRLGKDLLFLDGGTGSLLQKRGLKSGELPEVWNIERMEDMIQVQSEFFEAGSDIILTNTFGANAQKFHCDEYSLEDIITCAVVNAKEAAYMGVHDGRRVYVALDIGPTGKLLKPLGTLSFEEAYETYKEVVLYGTEAGADLIYIETMTDTYELKAAVLAAKENSNLPVFATVAFDEKGKLLTGADIPSVVALLEGLGVDALGMNCGLGPKQMLPLLDEMMKYASVPVIVKPNAGLPKQKDGETYYDVTPEEFADYMVEIVKHGASLVGGCCGTTPEYIQAVTEKLKDSDIFNTRVLPEKTDKTIVSAYGKAVEIGDKPVIIGERINPTGKKRFKVALKEKDIDYILKEAISQQDAGAHILDVNVGLPDIDEEEMMREVIKEIQSITSIPLQIDTVDPKALEAALRIYNGKPIINSVNGKQESMDTVFPLVKKYGGVVVGLTLDEDGIPKDADGRVRIAGKIIEEAAKYGIQKKDIVIDVLALTISSEPNGAKVTLEAIRKVKELYGVKTVLGVSNISFGLPNRTIINSHFYTMAMQNGLNAGIINPLSEDMMKSYHSYCALMEFDENCEQYIDVYGNQKAAVSVKAEQKSEQKGELTLYQAIEKGLREEAHHLARELVKITEPLTIINEQMVPALDSVGKGFESGEIFLPQLLMSAEAAKIAFAVLKENMPETEGDDSKKEKVILATVQGDIHDIGKNIVKVLLENYGFEVIDLGKDVDPEVIAEAVVNEDVNLVGLSALMTTTVGGMEDTIKLLRNVKPGCKIMVGGAVLTQEYADMIGADFYGKDAMQAVYYAQKLLKGEE